MRNYEHKTYSAEFKMAAIQEFQSRNVSLRVFVIEKGIALSTFESWLTKARKAGYQIARKFPSNLTPIEITKEAKEIIKENDQTRNESFTMKVRSMVFTFPLSSLKEVIEVISDDWFK